MTDKEKKPNAVDIAFKKYLDYCDKVQMDKRKAFEQKKQEE